MSTSMVEVLPREERGRKSRRREGRRSTGRCSVRAAAIEGVLVDVGMKVCVPKSAVTRAWPSRRLWSERSSVLVR